MVLSHWPDSKGKRKKKLQKQGGGEKKNNSIWHDKCY